MTQSSAHPELLGNVRKSSQGAPGLRILFIGTQMALGGAQRLLLDQAKWFASHGHDVTAAFFYDKQGLRETWGTALEFPLLTLSPLGSSGMALRRLAGLAAGLFSLWRVLRRGHFDVIVSFTYDSNLLAMPLAWLSGVPVRIATHHGIIEGFPRLMELLHSAIVNAGIASILVNVSRKVLEQAVSAGIRRERMTVIQNGIPANPAGGPDRSTARSGLGIGDLDVLVLSVGRLVYQKGHEYLIQAVAHLEDEAGMLRVLICGEGPLRPQLENQIARLSLENAVRLLGNQLDVNRFLRAADMFVLPSRWEGLPVALLEAMDAGLPVVATRVEGVEEVVQDGINGLLVRPEDARALAEAIRRIWTDRRLRERLAAGAKARVQAAYTADIMCEKYLALMLKLQPHAGRTRNA